MSTIDQFAVLAGLAAPVPQALAFALAWLVILLLYSPLADRIAGWFAPLPPRLAAFRALKESWLKLAAGIALAWLLGGFLEELLLRGVVLQSVAAAVAGKIGSIAANAVAILSAAAVAYILHLYQGPRAALIVAQLSALFGVLFVISGHNLWAVIVCHGLYDTIAFVRFARGTSRYSQFDGTPGT